MLRNGESDPYLPEQSEDVRVANRLNEAGDARQVIPNFGELYGDSESPGLLTTKKVTEIDQQDLERLTGLTTDIWDELKESGVYYEFTAMHDLVKPHFYAALRILGASSQQRLEEIKAGLIDRNDVVSGPHLLICDPETKEFEVISVAGILDENQLFDVQLGLTNAINTVNELIIEEFTEGSLLQRQCAQIIDKIIKFRKNNGFYGPRIIGAADIMKTGSKTAQLSADIAVKVARRDVSQTHSILTTIRNIMLKHSSHHVDYITRFIENLKMAVDAPSAIEKAEMQGGHYYKLNAKILQAALDEALHDNGIAEKPSTITYGCPFKGNLINWYMKQLEVLVRHAPVFTKKN